MDFTQVLCDGFLYEILEFCDLNSLYALSSVNKNLFNLTNEVPFYKAFMALINDCKKRNLFDASLLSEIDLTRIIETCIPKFLSSSLKNDFILLFVKILIENLSRNQLLDLSPVDIGINAEYLTIIIEALKVNKNIRRLWCCLNRNFEIFSKFLMDNQSITELSIISNNFEYGYSYLSKALIENKNIIKLDLCGSLIAQNEHGLRMLSDVLKANKTITELSVNCYKINNPEEWKILSEGLKSNQTIKTLDLSINSLGGHVDNMHFFSEALMMNKTITKLDLAHNEIENPEEWKKLFEAFMKNDTITSLNLSSNDEFVNHLENIQILSDFLKANKTITELSLKCYFINNPEGWKILSEGLKSNQTITTLNLSYNSLGVHGDNMHFFSEALMVNKTITKLIISNNEIENPEEWKKLFEAFMKNDTITSLNLSSNHEFVNHLENIQILSDFLKANKTITELYLCYNDINNPEEWKILSEGLKSNQTIKTLDLSINSLGGHVDNMHFFSEALMVNKTITKLDLANNKIKNPEVWKKLFEALKVNKSITCLDLNQDAKIIEFYLGSFQKY